MRRQVRQKAFETNSSSTHSVTISSDSAILDTFELDENGNLQLQFGEFGWEEQSFYDKWSRLTYASTYVFTWGSEEHVKLFYKVLKEHTGAKDILPHYEDKMKLQKEYEEKDRYGYPFGYIDHQSAESPGDPARTPFESEESLRMFLFNPNSSFSTDNDNH